MKSILHPLSPVALASLAIFAHPALLPAQPPAPAPAQAPPAQPAPLDSVRFLEREDGSSELQTAIISFQNADGAVIDLVSAVHIGDEAYFRRLNQHLSTYDVVLYEMVGGPMDTRDEREMRAEIGVTHLVQRVVQSLLGLKYQLDGIDYSPSNFVHADADWEQWKTLMEAKNENMTSLFVRALEMQDQEEVRKVLESMNGEDTMAGLLAAITEFNPNKFKRSLAPMLSESESFIQTLEGDEGSVLIAERNKIVMDAIAEQLAQGQRRIGVFYGAGHMPDFKNRLEAIGFSERRSDWMTAWNIGHEAQTLSGLDLMENLLKDDTVIEGFISFFRELAGESAP